MRLKSASTCSRPAHTCWAKPLIASCLLALPVSLPAQIVSYAGMQTTRSSTYLSAPAAIALDTSGYAYIVNRNASNVVKVDSSGSPTLITASFTDPDSVAVDGSGTIYVADYGANQVKRLAVSGGTATVTTIGTGISHPTSVVVDGSGNLYIAGTYSGLPQVLKISAAGSQSVVSSGSFTNPVGLAVDSFSNLYVTDTGSLTVPQKVSVVTITGTQTYVVTLLTGLTNTAKNIAVDPAGDILLSGGTTPYVTMYQVPAQLGSNGMIRQLGTGLSGPAGLAVDSVGTVYVADQTADQIDVIAPGPVNLGQANLCPSGGSQTAPCSQSVTLQFNVASGSSVTSASARVVTQGGANLDFTATANTCVGTLSSSCSITVLFDPLAPGVRLGAADVSGTISVAGLAGTTATLLATVPLHGTGLAPLAGFDAGTLSAPVAPGSGSYLTSVIADPAGNLYYIEGQSPSDTVGQTAPLVGSCVVKKFSVTGATTTFAGTGSCGTAAGDGGPATSAVFEDPRRLALSGRGDLYISDDQAHAIRKVDALTGIITTVAGTLNTADYSQDGTLASLAKLDSPFALAFDSSGDLYFSDTGDETVRKIDATSGVLYTVAGSHTDGCGYSGDLGFATSAQLDNPIGLALDPAGDLFIADQGNNLIREVSPSTGIITTAVGDADLVSPSACTAYVAGGYAGDNGAAASAQINDPEGVATDAAGNLYIADSGNYVVRKVNAATGIITTVGGSHSGSTQDSGVGGAANLAGLGYVQDVTVDSSGNFYLVDRTNNTIDEVTPASGVVNFAATTINTASSPVDVVLTNNGNAALDLSALSSDPNFNTAGADTSCTASTTLSTGESCTLGIEFLPTATGALTGALQVTDNAGDNPSATQALALTGTGAYAPTQIVLSGVPASVALGDNIGTFEASIESSGGIVVTNSTATVTATLTGPGSYSQTITASAVNGVASLDLSGLPLSTAGTYTLTVTSTGLTSASASVTVSPEATQLAVSGIPASIAPGANLGTATATIESATGAVITTSTAKVTTTVTGPGSYSQTVTATAVSGVATLDLTGLTLTTAGTYTVTTSSPFLKGVTSSVVVAASTLTLTGSGSAGGTAPSQTVTAGGAATYTFTIAPTSGSYAPVSFTATGLPAGATATFSPATLTPGPASQTTTLTIQTAASTAAVERFLKDGSGSLAIALGLLLFPLGASRRLRRAASRVPSLSLMLGLLSMGAVCGLMGCGGGSNSSKTGTTSQTYTVTVTATSGSTSSSTTVTLIVQ